MESERQKKSQRACRLRLNTPLDLDVEGLEYSSSVLTRSIVLLGDENLALDSFAVFSGQGSETSAVSIRGILN